jgi:hypothetical protein
MTDLPWDPGTDAPTLNGAKGRKCRRHVWWMPPVIGPLAAEWHSGVDGFVCRNCRKVKDPIASRRNRANGKRGRRAELTIAREIPGARKMGPLGLPWDVEVGEYARLQVKKLVSRPSANAIRKLIEAIPNTGDRLRGFVWVEAAGQGKRGRREVTFIAAEFAQWHGDDFGPVPLVTMPLADWCEEFVG